MRTCGSRPDYAELHPSYRVHRRLVCAAGLHRLGGGGIVAAIIVALLIPIVLIFCVAMGRAAELGDRLQMKFKKGH